MRKLTNLMVILPFVAGFFLLNSCGQQAEKKTDNDSIVTTTDNDSVILKPGEIPFDFPVVSSTSAKEGEYVLTPSRAFIDDAIKNGGDKAGFIYYYNTMVKPGEGESDVKEISGSVKIPNSLIIPIPAGQEAKVGDIVLSWWQSGSGMQRCYVVDAKDPKLPTVKYLDLDWDNPAKNNKGIGIGQMDEQLKLNSFVKLTGDWQQGTTIAFRVDGKYQHGKLLNVQGDKVLLLCFASAVKVAAKADCVPVPLKANVKAGDKVQVPYIGSYKNGVVKKVDTKAGRVWTEIEFGGQKKDIPVAWVDVATNLVVTE